MQTANLLQRIVRASRGTAATPALKVAWVYQDLKSRAWTENLWNRVAQLAGPDDVLVTAWALDELKPRPPFQEAVSAATLADVVMISIHASEQLPPGLCAWIDAWLPGRQRRDGALMVLLGVAAGQPEVPLVWTKEYLRAVARRGGLEFLLREHIETLPHPKTSARNEPSDLRTPLIHQPERTKS